MQKITHNLSINLKYSLSFTKDSFNTDNQLLKDILTAEFTYPVKVLIVIDGGIINTTPGFYKRVINYFKHYQHYLTMVLDPLILPGGEEIKNNYANVEKVYHAIYKGRICRHSYVLVIGGGAILDLVGFAASTAHRGVRQVRMPTTVLAQNDSGISVKNGLNQFGKKNFIGAFSVPYAVINDADFLQTLDSRDWRSGIAEAVKVAIIKDKTFFYEIEKNALELNKRQIDPMKSLINTCAKLHMEHIATKGDPFELTTSRPLDFGHWSAHKLESMTQYKLKHGEAVAIGIALDSTYSYLKSYTDKKTCEKILLTLKTLGFNFYDDALAVINEETGKLEVLDGLAEFQEHLGGELTLTMVEKIGQTFDVNFVDEMLYLDAIKMLSNFMNNQTIELLE